MKKLLIFALFSVLLFSAETAYACTCHTIDKDKDIEKWVAAAYGNAFAVFSGKVLAIKKSGRDNIIRLRLNQSWKRRLGKAITVTTPSFSGMCGYPFEKGKTYLIYAFGKNNNNLYTTVCTRTSNITTTNDIAVLDEIKKNPKSVPK